jgi:site-specific recombinase XerD
MNPKLLFGVTFQPITAQHAIMEVTSYQPPRPSGTAPRATASFRSRPRALNEGDMARLRQAVIGRAFPEDAGPEQMLMMHRDQAIALVLISTGVTLDETCALDTKDVRKDSSGRFHLVAQRYHRVIPLEGDTVKAVNRWLTLRQLVYRGQEFRPLFITRRRERITSVAVRNVLERLKVDSDVSFDSFALRHAFIRRRVQQGYSPDDISSMLGRPSRAIIQMYVAELDINQARIDVGTKRPS